VSIALKTTSVLNMAGDYTKAISNQHSAISQIELPKLPRLANRRDYGIPKVPSQSFLADC
jgi:hypothetical protein